MFLSLQSSVMDRSPWGDFYFEPIPFRGGSNKRVSSETAMQLSAVFRAVALVSGHMAMFPLQFFKRGTNKRVDHPLDTIFNVRPNPWQNSFEWREMLQGHLELRGNAYNEIVADSKGVITALIPRHPDRVRIDVTDSGDPVYYVRGPGGEERQVTQGSMWHLRGLSSNGYTGISVIEYARESMGLGLAAQSYGARFFANDAKPSSGWIEHPGIFKDAAAKMAFREKVQEAQSSANRGKFMVLESGMKYHEIGLNNQDSQFLETRKFQVGEMARWFGVPPHKIGDLERSTNNNIEHQALEYIQDALQPRAVRQEASIRAELIFDDDEVDIRFNFKELLRGDSKARSAYYHGGILDGWLTRNEARQEEGREPIDGLDEPLRPLNMVEEQEAEDDDGNKKDADAVGDKNDDQKTGDASRLKALLGANANRIARRIMKADGSVDPALVSESMAVSIDVASDWAKSFRWAAKLSSDEIANSLLNLKA